MYRPTWCRLMLLTLAVVSLNACSSSDDTDPVGPAPGPTLLPVTDLALVGPGRYTWANQATGDSLHGMILVPRYNVGDDYYNYEVRSLDGPEVTILDAQGMARVFSVMGGSQGSGDDRVDYLLQEDSPCLPGNHPDGNDCGTIGALGVGCGISRNP